jgi:hypothetical protein
VEDRWQEPLVPRSFREEPQTQEAQESQSARSTLERYF